MAFKAEMHIPPDEWASNALVFATEHEADQYGYDLLLRWTMPDDYRVVETDDPVNYELKDNELRRL